MSGKHDETRNEKVVQARPQDEEVLHFPPEDDLKNTKSMEEIIKNARKATDNEHKMTLWQGIKLYPKAVGWSLLISTCIAMEGYDVCLLSNFYGFPQFNQKYGEQLPDGTYQVPARWQAGLSNGANVGEIIGLFINGFVSERFGYRYTVMTCLTLIIAFTAIFFTAKDVVSLQIAEILCGIPWGVFQTLTITYASEVCPVALRGYLTTYVNFCWGLGQTIGVGVIKAMLPRTDEWAYRIPYVCIFLRLPLRFTNTSIGPAMDVAGSSPCRHRSCSRISLVARPQRPSRRSCPRRRPSRSQIEIECQRDSCHDATCRRSREERERA